MSPTPSGRPNKEACLDKDHLKGYCLVAAFTVTFYLALSNLDKLKGIVSAGLGLLTPFVIGLVIAFILNSPMRFFEQKAFAEIAGHKNLRVRKLARPLALLCTYLLVAAGMTGLLWFVVPQLITSINQLRDNIPGFLTLLQDWVTQLAAAVNFSADMWKTLSDWLQQMVSTLLGLLPKMFGMLPQLYNIVVSVGGGMFNVLVGLVVSIYLLLSKETLVRQFTRLNRAFLPKGLAGFLEHTGRITVQTFRNYITGQVTDAIIVGFICVVILSVLRFPYAMLIGVVMGCTNIIPFFGPFIGFIPGFLILVMTDPVRALWYTVIVVAVQQIDGNLIVPKVVGESVGLPPLWVLFSVTVGGGLFGIAGMVIGMPVFAVIYRLLGEATRKREPLPPEAA